jgi:hypothetical protein
MQVGGDEVAGDRIVGNFPNLLQTVYWMGSLRSLMLLV